MIRLRWILTGLVVVALPAGFLTVVGGTWAAASTPALNVQRIYGNDAIGTSLAVSQTEFPAAGSANAVVLARSDFFSDALAGGPLAAKLGGPLLITSGASQSSTLDPRVLAEIQRALPVGKTVYILGGVLALSPGIDAALQALGYVTQRIAGADEYTTAVDIAQQLDNPSTVFEATGLNFPDALSAVPAAVAAGGAILLTNGSVQSGPTGLYLFNHPGVTRYAIGGPLAAYGADPGATPVYGQDLFGTSAAVASTFFPAATMFGAATDATFPDALSGGAFMGGATAKGPLLLVQSSGPLPPSIASYLAGVASGLTQGYLFGGPFAVGNDVLSELHSVGGSSPPPSACTDPVWSTSDAEGTLNWNNQDLYWVNNDAWNGSAGPQTLYACSPSSWYAASDQPDLAGAVETYPDTEYDVGGRGSTPRAISSFTSVTSTFAEQAPNVGQWDAGYDIWTNNWGGEIMIWNQTSASLDGIYPPSDCVQVTIGGIGYCEWNDGGYGSEVILERDTQVASGSVDILAALQWLETQGLVKSTDTLTQIEYGIEVSSTAGASQTFAVNGFTVNVN